MEDGFYVNNVGLVKEVVAKHKEVMSQLAKEENRVDALAENLTRTEQVSREENGPGEEHVGKLKRNVSYHVYETVDPKDFLLLKKGEERDDKDNHEEEGEEGVKCLVQKCSKEHEDMEVRILALEIRIDRIEQDLHHQRVRPQAGAADPHNSPQRLPSSLSLSLQSLNSISEAGEDDETDSVCGSEDGHPEGCGKKEGQKSSKKKGQKTRRASDGHVRSGSEGFHEKMSNKMAHVTAKLGKIARVSRSVKVGSSKEEDKSSSKVIKE